MSRIGEKPINIIEGVLIEIANNTIYIKGPKGQLDIKLPDNLIVVKNDDQIQLKNKNKKDKNLHGLFRSLIYNGVVGVAKGWTKTLELVGVGYRAETTGDKLTLHLGYSHPIIFNAPEKISFQVQENKIIVSGIDKYLVGEVAARIRRIKPPEPYKGKGIKYEGEFIRRKAGKAAKAVGGISAK